MRAPFQVIVFPYQRHREGARFLIGKRADTGYWQAISGGGENAESPLEAAQRELYEETGLSGCHWVMLDSMCTLPKVFYCGHEDWMDTRYVIPEHAFMTHCPAEAATSQEHSELKWVTRDEANSLLLYDSNKNALWEACQRILSALSSMRISE